MGTAYRALRFEAPRVIARSKESCLYVISLSIFAALTFLPLVVNAATSPIGATAGNFRVSESGAATYNIPLSVPPGIAGMKPSLSINYSSQGGNGLLGMGWSLGGLSVIHRCPKTMAQDGVVGGVNFDSNDRFCIDGQRLVAISGSYGAPNTEYRTESESYSRIISYGTTGTGPSSFKVWTKSGQIMEYGNTTDSRIQPQAQATAMLWALNKVSDTVGNYLTITYTQDQPNGQFYPSRIDYAGNSNTGKTPTNSVQFIYETRPDITPMYQAGALMKTTVRMTNVKTYTGATLTKDYRLTYNTSAATQRSRIATLTECAGDGVCFGATSLAYQQGGNGFTSDPDIGSYTSAITWSVGGNFWGDVNGDGRADFVYLQGSTSNWHVLLSNSTSLGADTVWGNNTQGIKWDTGDYPRIIDVNADGKADIVYYQAGTGATFRVLLSSGNAFPSDTVWATTTQSISSYGGSHQFFLVDVDGDGKPDIVYLQNGTATWRAALSSQGGSNTLGPDIVFGTQSFGTVSTGGYHAHYWADVNGDGKVDLIYQQDGTSTWRVMLSNGTSLGTDTAWGNNTQGIKWDTGDGPRFADINGDGKADLVYYQAGTGAVFRVLLSNGKSFASDSVWGTTNFGISSYGGSHQFFFVDVDGDGKPDIVYLQDNTATWRAAISGQGTNNTLGPDTVLGTQSFGTVSSGGYHAHYWADINGDGKTDLVYLKDGTALFKSGFSPSPYPDLLTTLANGLGVTTTITYKPITDGSVYTKDTSAVYPYMDMQAPMYVVSHVTNSDGIGGNYAMDYSYAGAKAHLQGGGYMGFRQFTTHDPQTQISTTTTFRQTYPYQGMPLTTQRMTDSSVVLNQSTNTYTDTLLNTALSPVYHQSLLTMSVETSNELNGSPVTTVTSNTSYDSYGNPLQIVVSTGDGYSKTTTNTYDNIIDSNRWFLGRLRRSSVTSVTP